MKYDINFIKKPNRKVSRVFLHCSANSNAKWGIEDLKASHISRGFSDIGYHFFIDFAGKIFIGRSLETNPAAQVGHNTGTIAICLHGGQDSKADFKIEQYHILKSLCKQICEAYNNQITFHGHCEVSAKDCPVFDYKEVLSLDEKGYIQTENSKIMQC